MKSTFKFGFVGRGLLAYVLSRLGHETVYLDVLADNEGAIRLYQSLGFKIVEAYEGFSGQREAVRCYHMRRLPAEEVNP